MICLSQKTTLTIEKDEYIMKNDTLLELLEAIVKKGGIAMPTATLTTEEIQQFYNEYGINQKAHQSTTSEEPKIMMDYAIPTVYTQVPLVYSDKVNI